MNNQDRDAINENLESLKDLQKEMSTTISNLLNQISELEIKYDEYFNLSHLLSGLRNTIESVDIDGFFNFIDDMESEIESVSYNYKKAEKANDISAYKVVNGQVPMYFNQNL